MSHTRNIARAARLLRSQVQDNEVYAACDTLAYMSSELHKLETILKEAIAQEIPTPLREETS